VGRFLRDRQSARKSVSTEIFDESEAEQRYAVTMTTSVPRRTNDTALHHRRGTIDDTVDAGREPARRCG
jgi:hypothetical protein